MFQGGARRATAALQQATREARKALEAVGWGRSSLPPTIVDWLALDVKGWERHGMLSTFTMRGGRRRAVYGGAGCRQAGLPRRGSSCSTLQRGGR
eukprot:4750890-Pleurochrysis_carterae.AAC.1